MEAKLKVYRALRRRKQLIDGVKEKLENTKQKLVNLLVPNTYTDMDKEKKEEEVLLLEDEEPPVSTLAPLQPEITDLASEVSELESFEVENEESWRYFLTKWSIYSIIWLTLYVYFLKVGFGAVFFVVSLLIGICLNTSTRKRKRGEVSAYSVFNENCKSIDGTIKAEQFEKEMRYGVGSIKLF